VRALRYPGEGLAVGWIEDFDPAPGRRLAGLAGDEMKKAIALA
jgi:hypothetical protein